MKIGILTFHRPINYGAFLQSYALSNRLNKDIEDCTVEIIDYIAPKENKKIYTNVLRRTKHQGISSGIKEIKKIRIFKGALKHLKLSSRKICSDNLQKLYEYINSEYDALIIGSDAVFNWNQNGYPTAFIPNHVFSIPVYTYAASVHGLSFYDEPSTRIAECGQAFMNMKQVFTRDECSKQFVEYCTPECTVKHACDPTFLIDFDQLYSIPHRSFDSIKEKYGIKRPYIVLMVQNDDISKAVYTRYHSDFDIITLFINNKFSDIFLADLTPIEWCMMLKNASVVITSYFHGTLLSLQQNVPAIVLDVSHYSGRYEGKLKDMMERRLGLSELYFSVDNAEGYVNGIITVIEECLAGKFKERIRVGVENERKTYSVFLDYLKTIICTSN